MENANVGGNRGSFTGGQPDNFDTASQNSVIGGYATGDQGAPGNFGASGNFGAPEVFGTPESFEQALSDLPKFGETPNLKNLESAEAFNSNDVPVIENVSEMKPLAADGSTEGKMGKLALKMSGEVMDEASAKELRQEISKLEKTPYELWNRRDEEMVDWLRDKYGRIFGNDNDSQLYDRGGSEVA